LIGLVDCLYGHRTCSLIENTIAKHLMKRHITVIPDELLASVSVASPELDTEAGAQALVDVMDTFGFAVITDVLNEDETAVAEALFDEDLFSIVDLPDEEKMKQTCFERKSGGKSYAKRWPSDMFPLGRANPAFASDYGLPQGKCAWKCRTNQRVRRVFEVMFQNCKELCVGMDNMFFDNSRENRTIPDSDREDDLWPHADQSLHADGGDKPCYQGVVYLWPSNEYSSTTVVWPGSHKDAYVKMMAERAYGHHYCRLPPQYHEDFAKGAVRVVIPRGGMILWNSKTIHQGWNIGPRLAVPICMEPKDRRAEGVIDRKRLAVEKGVPTTHWASLGLIHGCVTERPGGSKKFPLCAKAQEWIMASGDIDPSVAELL
jgi:hypothetical protein